MANSEDDESYEDEFDPDEANSYISGLSGWDTDKFLETFDDEYFNDLNKKLDRILGPN